MSDKGFTITFLNHMRVSPPPKCDCGVLLKHLQEGDDLQLPDGRKVLVQPSVDGIEYWICLKCSRAYQEKKARP